MRAHNSRSILIDDIPDSLQSRHSFDTPREGQPSIYHIDDMLDEGGLQLANSNGRLPAKVGDVIFSENEFISNPQYEAISRNTPQRSSSSPGLLRLKRAVLGKSSTERSDDSKKDYSHLDRGDSFALRGSRRSMNHVSSLITNPPSLPPSPATNRDKRRTAPGYSSYSPKLQGSPLADSLSPPPPYQQYSPLVRLSSSSNTADYAEIQNVMHGGNNQENVAISHEYSEPIELERRPSNPTLAGAIEPYSVVNNPTRVHNKPPPLRDSDLLTNEYGQPTELDREVTGGNGHKRAILPYSQVSNTDIDKNRESDEYNQPTALYRQLPEIPSYGTVPEQHPQQNGFTPDFKISNSELGTDSGEYGQPTALDRKLPEIPASVKTKPGILKSIRKSKKTIPPYSVVSKKTKNVFKSEPSPSDRDLPAVPSSPDNKNTKRSIEPYSQVSKLDVQPHSSDAVMHSPRLPRSIPPYSQVSNTDIDKRKKKTSADTVLLHITNTDIKRCKKKSSADTVQLQYKSGPPEPSPYSEPIHSGRSRKSEPILEGIHGGRKSESSLEPVHDTRSGSRKSESSLLPMFRARSGSRKSESSLEPTFGVRSGSRKSESSLEPTFGARSGSRKSESSLEPTFGARSGSRKSESSLEPTFGARSGSRKSESSLEPTFGARSGSRKSESSLETGVPPIRIETLLNADSTANSWNGQMKLSLGPPVMIRSPSPYSEPVIIHKPQGSTSSTLSNPFSPPSLDTPLMSSSLDRPARRFDILSRSADFNDYTEPSPYSEPITSSGTIQGGSSPSVAIPAPYSEPCRQGSSTLENKGEEPKTERPPAVLPAPYSDPLRRKFNAKGQRVERAKSGVQKVANVLKSEAKASKNARKKKKK